MSSRRKEGKLGLVVLGAVLLLAMFLTFLPRNSQREGEGSVNSVEPDGRRALYALLTEFGIDARAFVDAPRDLPRGKHLLWLPHAPTSTMPARHVDFGHSGDPDRIGLHRLDFYKTFVESGGTIVLAQGGDTVHFLVETLGLLEAETLAIDETVTTGTQHVRTSSGAEIEMDCAVSGALHPLDQNGSARALWTIEREGSTQPFAAEFPSGLGSVVVLAHDAFVENRHIGEQQHALAAVRLVEELAGGGPVLFSEYEAGRWAPQSTLSLLFGPTLFLASLHGLVLLGLFVWMHGYARAFTRDPEPLALFSPYLRARSLADVFTRARRLRGLAAMLASGALARYRVVARLHARRPVVDEENGAALPRVRESDVAEFVREAGLVNMQDELNRALAPQSPKNTAALDDLSRRLAQLEDAIEKRVRGRADLADRTGKS